MVLGQHIAEYLIACSMCKTVFPDGIALSYHIKAVHEKLRQKHTIEKESSLRIHKVKRFNGRVYRKRLVCRLAHVNPLKSVLLLHFSFGSNIYY